MRNPEESDPLLVKQSEVDGNAKHEESPAAAAAAATPRKTMTVESGRGCCERSGWTADGMPLGHGSVVGEPVARARWNSNLFACLGRNDEFCSSDLEVCVLGSFSPCMLYGSNAERLGSGSGQGTFANHCLSYTGLFLLGNSLFGWNFLAPWFSYPTRTAIRRKFNLEGTCEALSRSCGCCGSIIEDEVQREQYESACDFATHFFCHACSLCQEARELRRKLPHPGFNGQPILVMIPPTEQTMGRGGA